MIYIYYIFCNFIINESKYYDDISIKNKVYQIYKKDFDLFNYKY